jgi:hypothetical protein
MAQREVDRGSLSPHAIAIHDRPNVCVLDLDVSPRSARTPIIHHTCIRAGTAQPAVAAYESGARTPNLVTLRKLLSACEYDVELLARPRMRRGAA